jgi:hypothetical protein
MTDIRELAFIDKTIICIECEKPFVFTAGEQRFYYEKQLTIPKRCPQCRMYRKLTIRADRGGNGNG